MDKKKVKDVVFSAPLLVTVSAKTVVASDIRLCLNMWEDYLCTNKVAEMLRVLS